MIARLAHLMRFRRDSRGAAITEFGIIAPTFLLMLMGVFDIGYSVYLRATLSGAVQKAARDSTLETGAAQQSAIDDKVKEVVGQLAKDATFDFQRKSYFDFDDVGRPESFTDDNANGTRDPGECFEDENGNSSWDSDVGKDGFGGAKDAVLYTVTVSYDRIFPLYKFIGASQQHSVSESTVLLNQPYGEQQAQQINVVCT